MTDNTDLIARREAVPIEPCPFCAGRGIAHRVPTGWRVSCSQCDCQPRPGFPPDSEDAAITVWNRRTALEASDADTVRVPRGDDFADTERGPMAFSQFVGLAVGEALRERGLWRDGDPHENPSLLVDRLRDMAAVSKAAIDAMSKWPEASRSPVSEERAKALLAEEGIEIMNGGMAYRANINTGDAIMRSMIRFATDTQPSDSLSPHAKNEEQAPLSLTDTQPVAGGGE